ncbi:MAG: threonylcarbamoyl-AMP synthase [Clostridia bacterium]|nr:threonylcarbamoyl-AMP synthase [Clostridia bacterium]
MNTQLLPATDASLALAARLLADGQLVAFPTETVYGLGANALDEAAVRSIFAAKGRPADNPLIVHIHDRTQLTDICEVTESAVRLMDAFWPGPLTIILPRKETVPDVVTAGLDTVAVRMPAHPVALAMLRACKLPIAAPSANRSGKPSPTSAKHVFDDMNGRIPLILDGGESDVGLESTVISLAGEKPCILRPGGITKAMLEAVVGPVELAGSILRPLEKGEKALSPGMMYKHYSPDGQVTLIEGEESAVVEALRRLYAHAASEGHRACVMCFTEHVAALADCNPHDIGSKDDPSEVAHRLFATLRGLDDEKMDVIFSEVVPPEGVGLAVMNRLGRAAAFRTVRAEEVL